MARRAKPATRRPAARRAKATAQRKPAKAGRHANKHGRGSGHRHGRGDDHGHSTVPSNPALRIRALESILVEKGIVRRDSLDAIIQAYEREIGPQNGARVVARAWVDPAYKARLLNNATAAVAELGIGGMQGEDLIVVENTPTRHNLIVCTLCSCYPWAVLGLPPTWYKMPAYRARAVAEPLAVLREFGVELPDTVEVETWDSTAEIRYLVLPERPAGTEGLSEAALAKLVSRDAMLGVAKVKPPKKRRAGAAA